MKLEVWHLCSLITVQFTRSPITNSCFMMATCWMISVIFYITITDCQCISLTRSQIGDEEKYFSGIVCETIYSCAVQWHYVAMCHRSQTATRDWLVYRLQLLIYTRYWNFDSNTNDQNCYHLLKYSCSKEQTQLYDISEEIIKTVGSKDQIIHTAREYTGHSFDNIY